MFFAKTKYIAILLRKKLPLGPKELDKLILNLRDSFVYKIAGCDGFLIFTMLNICDSLEM